MNDLRSNIETLFTSDTTYLIPPGVDETQWYLDTIMGLVDTQFSGVTRLELVDNTKCKYCAGTGRIMTPQDSAAGQSIAFNKECPNCHGLGFPGRSVVFWNKNKKIDLSLQDDNRTLKLFIGER